MRTLPLRRLAPALLVTLLSGAAFAAGAAPATPAHVLASYSFDDRVETGPDTFAIWEGARHRSTGRGSVSLSPAFHWSGDRSVELRDVAGDGDFPELQGYFPVRSTGRLLFHFAFLTAEAKEELNVALAGPKHFRLVPDGIAFWLATRDGSLVHVSDSIPKKLFAIEPFVWYGVDVDLDLAAGVYDLTVQREGTPEPVVRLRGQANATAAPGSAVSKFSFVGSPLVDTSDVVFYVDDVVLATDAAVAQPAFVAPGRRRLFVDAFGHYQRLLRERPRCLPPTDPEDFGLAADDVAALAGTGILAAIESAVSGEPLAEAPAVPIPEAWTPFLGALDDWRAGCASLAAGDPAVALARFDRASTTVPEAPLFTLSAVLALAGAQRVDEADERLLLLWEWRDDPRFAVASAYLGLARGELDRAEAWLRDPASRVLDRAANPLLAWYGRGDLGGKAVAALRERAGPAFRELLEETLVAEQFYYVRLWQGENARARDYALRMAARLTGSGLAANAWTERAGDAAFYLRDLAESENLYRRAIEGESDWGALRTLYLKLADLAFLNGDLEGERKLREHYYGALRE